MIKPRPFVTKMIAGTLLGGLGALDKEAEPYIPPELKEAIKAAPIGDEFKKAILPLTEMGASSPVAAIVMMLLGMVIAAAFGVAAPIARSVSYEVDKQVRSFRFDPSTVTQLWLRGFPNEEDKEKWWEQLKDQGFHKDQIDAAKELAKILPTPSDLVMWQAREVFEPEMVEKYGLLDEVELIERDLFYKVGMSDEMIENYWKAHWQHASWMQIVQMRRRELITDDDVWEWFRLVEIPPFWRENLTKLIWEIPTRVDVRRWYDMGTIDETELRSIYGRRGYHGKDLDNYIIWTKVYVHFPDLMSRYKNGWITIEEVKKQLVEVDRMPEERFEELLQTKIKAVQEERVADTTALTRSLIIKGAKEDKLTREETIELLMRKNYALWEAEYIYDIEVAAASSPETPAEFRQMVESYRKAVGLDFKEVPGEVLEASKKLSDLRSVLSQARLAKAPQEELSQLQADLEIAEIEVQQLKADYGL